MNNRLWQALLTYAGAVSVGVAFSTPGHAACVEISESQRSMRTRRFVRCKRNQAFAMQPVMFLTSRIVFSSENVEKYIFPVEKNLRFVSTMLEWNNVSPKLM